MNLFLYSLEMPFSKTKLYYRELTSKEQIYLSKAHTMMPLDEEFLEDYGRVLTEIMIECVKNKEEFLNLNLIEYVLFLCKLRINSIGENIELFHLNEKKESVKLTLNLSSLMQKMYNICKNIFVSKKIIENGIEVELDWPLLKHESFFLRKNNNKLLESVPLYIKNFSLNGKTFSTKNFTELEIFNIFDEFPFKYQIKIQEEVFKELKNFTELSIFEEHLSKFLNFNFYNLSYQNLLRLFFTDNLKNLYQIYYILSSRRIPPSYTDQMTIAERDVYYSLIQSELQQSSEENSSEGISIENLL